MAIEYTPQYSLLATVTNAGTFAVQIGAASVTNLVSTLSTVTNAGTFAVQITSLPDFASTSAVKITSLPDLGLNSSVKITSLPALTSGSVSVSNLVSTLSSVTNAGLFAVQITSLPNFAIGTPVLATVTNVGTFAVQVTSLPALAVGSIVSVSGLTSAIVSISNLPISVLATVTNAGVFAVSSLPALNITSLPPFPLTSVLSTVTNAGTFLVQVGKNTNNWSFTSTYTAAQTNVVLVALPGSTSALNITDVIFANSSTEGNLSLIESRSNTVIIKVKLETMYFKPYGGAVINLRTPIVLDTNAALCMTSRTVTAHSVTVVGYTT